MQIKDILSDTHDKRPPLFKSDSYTNIYKKTEKIACAVFLLTDTFGTDNVSNTSIKDVRVEITQLLRAVLDFLSEEDLSARKAYFKALSTRAHMVRSLLFILAAAHQLKGELSEVLAREIDSVVYQSNLLCQDELAEYGTAGEELPLYVNAPRRMRSPMRTTPSLRVTSPKEGERSQAGGGRKEVVLALIKERGEVSIKDISDSIKDCSEKTIQRLLTELIKDNLVTREGERRWSRYKLAQ